MVGPIRGAASRTRIRMRVLICGGGVVGGSIAYFLSCRDIAATVIERRSLACAASGKSGGFLALDWCDSGPLQELARRSFLLHALLADELPGDWGYRRLATYGGVASARAEARCGLVALGWIADRVSLHQRLGSPDTTAQVSPAAFTAALMRAAEKRGATLRLGNVTGLARAGARVVGVEVDGEIIPGDAVVIALGPWSILASQWLPLPAVFGLKGHSIVFDTGAAASPQALFLEFEEASGAMQSPEVFPRPDGTTYVCAISSAAPLPLDPAAIEPDPGAIERLDAMCRAISPVLARAKVLARQACFRPVTQDGLPLIGPVPGIAGAYVATGHSVWGMLNAPATGEAIADIIADGAARIDLAPFDPARLPVLDPARLRARTQGASGSGH
jgi:glycine/D-amino acid oxidase-like deaminating enzyme